MSDQDPTPAENPADRTQTAEEARRTTEAEHYASDLLARGEAIEVEVDERGVAGERKDLPPGVTHEIVPGKDGEPATVVRRRYSAY